MMKTPETNEKYYSEEIRILTNMADRLDVDDTTCMCDGCSHQYEFVEKLRDLIKWVRKEKVY